MFLVNVYFPNYTFDYASRYNDTYSNPSIRLALKPPQDIDVYIGSLSHLIRLNTPRNRDNSI